MSGARGRGEALRIYVFGAGKVGRAWTRAWRAGGVRVTLRAQRRGFPRRAPLADLLVLAVRDSEVAPLADALAKRAPGAWGAVVHCAGALDETPLSALRQTGAAVGCLHPLVSLADGRGGELGAAFAHVSGDERAVAIASRAARAAGLTPFDARVDPALYHAGAALLANGAAALAAAATELLVRAGVGGELAPKALGALLESVGRNVRGLGLPAALTGPVRRGDAAAIAAHLSVLERRAPELVPLYVALAAAQVPLARSLGEATTTSLTAIEATLKASAKR